MNDDWCPMIEIATKYEGISLAIERRAQMPVFPKESILDGKGTLPGVVCEIYTAQYLGSTLAQSFDFDMWTNGSKDEIKTHICTSRPKPHYMARVCGKNDRQNCDRYIFCRILKDLSKLWIVGMMPRKDFFDTARFICKGEIQEDGFECKQDCWQLRIAELFPVPNHDPRIQISHG